MNKFLKSAFKIVFAFLMVPLICFGQTKSAFDLDNTPFAVKEETRLKINEAAELVARGKNGEIKCFSEAEEKYNKILEQEPANLMVNMRLQSMYLFMEDYDKYKAAVIRQFESALKMGAKFAPDSEKELKKQVDANIKMFFGEKGMVSTKEKFLEVARKTKGLNKAGSKYEADIIRAPKEDFDYWLKKTKETPKQKNGFDVNFMMLSMALNKLGSYELSLAECNKLITSDPLNPDWYKLRADLYEGKAENAKAIEDQETILKLVPGKQETLLKLGVLLFRSSENEKSLAYLNKAAEITPENSVVFEERAKVLIELGREDEANNDRLKAAVLLNKPAAGADSKASPSSGRIMMVSDSIKQAELYFEAGEYKKVIEAVNSLANENKVIKDSMRILLGKAYLKTKEYDKAIVELSDVDLENAGYQKTQVYTYLGYTYECKGDMAKAREYYKKTLELDGMGSYYYGKIKYGNKFNHLSDPEIEKLFSRTPEESIEYYGRKLAEKPDTAELYIERAELLAKINKTEEALKDYGKAIELEPKQGYLKRASFYHRVMGDPNKALDDYLQVVKLDSKDAETYESIGRLYESNEDYPLAVDYFGKAIEMSPGNYRFYANRARLYERELKQPEKARADYLRSAETRINEKDNTSKGRLRYIDFSDRGNLYFSAGQYTKAVEDFSKSLELDSENTEYTLGQRAESYLKLKEYDKALEDLLILQVKESKTSIDQYQKVKTMTEIGFAYEQKGQKEKAEEYYKKAKSTNESLHSFHLKQLRGEALNPDKKPLKSVKPEDIGK